ncbi:hypothetical protein E8E11_010066 [Didymella keratinophila]|nr:hypothetical protein E8E11_010066 [Didymella keratinophila]
MLVLAIAEAYRPRPRPRPGSPAAARQQPPSTVPARLATFATNLNARASFSSSRPQTPSVPSRNASVTSHSRSFISFISRRGRPGPSSASSDATITPQDAIRADSVFSQATAARATHPPRKSEGSGKAPPTLSQPASNPIPHASTSPARPTLSLPRLSAPRSLPPQEELPHFNTALQSAIEDLHAPPPGSDTALTILSHMSYISDLACCIATSWPEYYSLLLHASKLLISVLPAPEVAARNALVRCLADTAQQWNGSETQDTISIARTAGSVFDSAVHSRRMLTLLLGRSFGSWLSTRAEIGRSASSTRDKRSVRILTLGVSRAVLAGLQYALAEDPGLEIHLGVLTALDQDLPAPPSYERLHITGYPTSAIGTASQGVDVLVLEPSYIDPTGDLECQNGALGTAVCVKTLSPSAKVVALGGGDSIAISVVQGLTTAKSGGGINDTPKRVPSKFLDLHIVENGAPNIKELQGLAEAAGQLHRQVLGEDGA